MHALMENITFAGLSNAMTSWLKSHGNNLGIDLGNEENLTQKKFLSVTKQF